MLEPERINELVKIGESAIKEMYEHGYEEFFVESITWDDDSGYWLVRFYCERGNIENLSIAIEPQGGDYRFKCFVYD